MAPFADPLSEPGIALFLLGVLVVFFLALSVLFMKLLGRENTPTVSTMHRLNFDLQERGRAELSSKTDAKQPAGVVRIALTGGPCAGKSSALAHIIETAKKNGFDCYVGPETATVTMNCGCAVPGTLEGLQIFQSQIFKVQLQMETALTDIARETNRPSIIIFDRGIFDGKAYIPDDIWVNVISQYDVDATRDEIEEMLLLRYEAVVHMVTAADGAEAYYKFGHTTDNSGKPVHRRESAAEATELDQKMWKLWQKHPSHIRIENPAEGFDRKLEHVATEVVRVAKESIGNLDGDDETIEKRTTMNRKVSALVGREISSSMARTSTRKRQLERYSVQAGQSVIV